MRYLALFWLQEPFRISGTLQQVSAGANKPKEAADTETICLFWLMLFKVVEGQKTPKGIFSSLITCVEWLGSSKCSHGGICVCFCTLNLQKTAAPEPCVCLSLTVSLNFLEPLKPQLVFYRNTESLCETHWDREHVYLHVYIYYPVESIWVWMLCNGLSMLMKTYILWSFNLIHLRKWFY